MISARYIAHSGDDLMVVNAARVSFAKAILYFAYPLDSFERARL